MLSKIRSAFGSFTIPPWSIPVMLLALTIITYGLRALPLGFFWDDWVYQWVFHRYGPAGIVSAFAQDRPFLSFIYIVSFSILGNSTVGWQIFGLLARWLCGVGLWFALAQAWPRHANKTAWAAFLFTIYPGFTQQWISVIYAQAFFLFAAPFFSIGLTLWMARNRQRLKIGWIIAGTLFAILLSAFCMFSTEYFFGLELLRPMLLWIVFLNEKREATEPKWPAIRRLARQTAIWWAPYLGLMVLFVFWRMVIHPFTGYTLTTVSSVEHSPLSGAQHLAQTILQDFVVSGFASWGQPLVSLEGFLEKDLANGLRLLAVILVTGLLVTWYFLRLRPPTRNETQPGPAQSENWALQAVIVGILAFLVSGWPTWITGLAMRMGFPLDRYSLSLSVGTSLALAGAIDAIGKNNARKAAVLGLLIALAAGFQFNTALLYEKDWNITRDFFWQLTWRAPGLQPNTLLASDSMAFQFSEDDSLTAPLNWTYDPQGRAERMPYMLYDFLVRRKTMPSIDPPVKEIDHGFRGGYFSGSTSQVLVFYYSPPGCVRILDPVLDADFNRLPDRLLQFLPASNPQGVILDSSPSATPPTDVFGSEPKHRWCYYFEKAELARQKGDWKTITELGKQSIGKGYRPEDSSEYLPFIEGYARYGLTEDALQLSLSAQNEAPSSAPAICSIWKRAFQNDPGLSAAYSQRIRTTFNCSIP